MLAQAKFYMQRKRKKKKKREKKLHAPVGVKQTLSELNTGLIEMH